MRGKVCRYPFLFFSFFSVVSLVFLLSGEFPSVPWAFFLVPHGRLLPVKSVDPGFSTPAPSFFCYFPSRMIGTPLVVLGFPFCLADAARCPCPFPFFFSPPPPQGCPISLGGVSVKRQMMYAHLHPPGFLPFLTCRRRGSSLHQPASLRVGIREPALSGVVRDLLLRINVRPPFPLLFPPGPLTFFCCIYVLRPTLCQAF